MPKDKLYSHVGFMTKAVYAAGSPPEPYRQITNFSPRWTAFGASHDPGFSTYPQPDLLNEIQKARANHGNPPWASVEGSPVDPAQAQLGHLTGDMERYLGDRFNGGAVLVNLFGWGVGDANNPFRKVAESPNAIAAYRKFLQGKPLLQTDPAIPGSPSGSIVLEKEPAS